MNENENDKYSNGVIIQRFLYPNFMNKASSFPEKWCTLTSHTSTSSVTNNEKKKN